MDETIDTLLDGDSVPENGPRNGARNILGNGLSNDFVLESADEETRYDEDLSAKVEPGDGSASVAVSDDAGGSSKSRALFSDMDLLLPQKTQQDRPAPRFEAYDGDEGMQTYASPPRREKKPGLPPGDKRMGVSTNRRRGASEGENARERASDGVAAAKNRLEDRFQGEDRSAERSRQRQRSGDAPFAATAAAISAAVAAESDGVELDALDAIVGAFLSDDGGAIPESPPPETEASTGGQKGGDVDPAVIPPTSEVLSPDDASVENSGQGLGSGSSAVSEIGGMKVTELKEKCKAMGLPVSGRKAELQERILKALG